MATVEEVARGALAAIGSDTNFLIAAQFVVDRYRQIAARTQFRSLRQMGELYVPAPITAGTATFTRDSTQVTGDATAQAAWSTAQVGWYIRGGVAWYEVEGIQGKTLVLRSKYAEDTSTAGSYNLIQRLVTLDPRSRWVSPTMVNQRRRLPVHGTQLDALNDLAPERPYQPGDVAQFWCAVGDRVNPDGVLCSAIELYPYSSTSEKYDYVFYPVTMDLGITDLLPTALDPHVLREGVLADLMRVEMGKAIRRGDPNGAAIWRNDYRAQETRWEKTILDAFHADSMTDDLAFILQRNGYTALDRDIKTAWDVVLSRWPR